MLTHYIAASGGFALGYLIAALFAAGRRDDAARTQRLEEGD